MDGDGYKDTTEVLEDARDFLIDNIEEINEYLSKNSESDIKKRYTHFLEIKDEE